MAKPRDYTTTCEECGCTFSGRTSTGKNGSRIPRFCGVDCRGVSQSRQNSGILHPRSGPTTPETAGKLVESIRKTKAAAAESFRKSRPTILRTLG